MASHAKIKYLSDNQKATVPVGHFRVVHNDLVQVEDLEVGDSYKVFWSSCDLDSPLTVEAAGNDILDVDDMPASEVERRRKLYGGPLPGWYNAILLSLRDSDGELNI